MDWKRFLCQELGKDDTGIWEGARLTRGRVSLEDRCVYIYVDVLNPVPRAELESLERLIEERLGLDAQVKINVQLGDAGSCLARIMQARKDELLSYLLGQGIKETNLRGIEWKVVGESLVLEADSEAKWEEALSADLAALISDWFNQEYRWQVIVKCSHPDSSTQGDNLVQTLAPASLPVADLLSFQPRTRARRRNPANSCRRKTESKDSSVHGDIYTIAELTEGLRQVVVQGEVFEIQHRALKDGRRLLTCYLTDFTDSVMLKYFLEAGESPPFNNGDWIKVKGSTRHDEFEKELVLSVQAWETASPPKRLDNAPEKRVELHLHTVMSALDGVVRIKDLMDRVAEWGHKAVAITDHGVVQGFPEAYEWAKARNIKLVYGMEGYLVDELRQKQAYHVIILVKNRQGLKNLYRLVSKSHLEDFYRNPRILRKDLVELREGLILGTACEAGELITGYLQRKTESELEEIASFYDFLEIQPLANNEFLVREGRVNSLEDIAEMNRYLVELGERLGIPVIATGDVHFLDPHHEVLRRILQANKGFEDAEAQAPLYFRTTEEMLAEFAYLGEEKAYQVVVVEPNRLVENIEELQPVPEGNFFPSISGAEEEIKRLAWDKAYQLYGNPLPEVIERRLERELQAIINNKFSVLYLIAHELVKRSNEDGYLVGSRGSVGSSLVAFFVGITEVNPLPPHYRCPGCFYTEFVDDGSQECGVDLPDLCCPRCGHRMARDGYDIPFETFLGFEGDKVPDIDLNFSGEYQARAHQCVEEIFGKEHVFRAGTINTLAEASAIGMVKNYAEKNGIHFSKGEILRLARGLTGVKRTTGQHPGGLMVVPREHDVHEFTPLNYPANKGESGIITTHFDYHSISERLVKLDILGHDDPTMIKVLEDMTGHRALEIPLDDPETMKLFSGVEPLGVTPEAIRSAVGTYGVPEFGTRFVRQMLEVTRPQSFGELVRISGLSHGTDVWLNNAQELIENGVASLKEVIATRDNIMTFLIHKEMDKKQAFRIMENVRKGKGLTEDEVRIMQAHGVPDWYIDSCQKIKYMFPRAHAVAYVMMAFRIAYYKVYYPMEFYAAFFSVRAEDFDAEVILGGYDRVRQRIVEIEKMNNNATPKDRKLLPVLEVALEMYARGYRFLPVSLDSSDATRFLVTNGGLLLPFSALPGVGEKAALSIIHARNQGGFVSVEDLQMRSGISRAVVDTLRRSGCLNGLPETSQLSLFA